MLFEKIKTYFLYITLSLFLITNAFLVKHEFLFKETFVLLFLFLTVVICFYQKDEFKRIIYYFFYFKMKNLSRKFQEGYHY